MRTGEGERYTMGVLMTMTGLALCYLYMILPRKKNRLILILRIGRNFFYPEYWVCKSSTSPYPIKLSPYLDGKLLRCYIAKKKLIPLSSPSQKN